MALPLPELRAKEIPHRLSQLSLAAFSRAGFNDPDPAVTPIVLQGHLASTDISVSILIDTGASLDAVSEKYARTRTKPLLSRRLSGNMHGKFFQWASAQRRPCSQD